MAVPETHALHAVTSDRKTSIDHIETLASPVTAETLHSGLEHDPNNPMVSL